MLIERHERYDTLLQQYAPVIGADYMAYRNHGYRMMNYCLALAGEQPDGLEKVGIAAAFHDLGIWTDHTFDYLPPSERLARDWLVQQGKTEWVDEVVAMIAEHHKVSACGPAQGPLVEAFRRADWVDVTLGLRRFGLPRSLMREVNAVFPNEGFHWRLVQLSASQAWHHPLNPLPMFKR
ncbi:hypothetical protein [Chitinimonas sp.]|uniref:hypothetical protein n=1 Tax=Chitinimonas sp. TaxID=1934313 RepID=UPI002F951351